MKLGNLPMPLGGCWRERERHIFRHGKFIHSTNNPVVKFMMCVGILNIAMNWCPYSDRDHWRWWHMPPVTSFFSKSTVKIPQYGSISGHHSPFPHRTLFLSAWQADQKRVRKRNRKRKKDRYIGSLFWCIFSNIFFIYFKYIFKFFLSHKYIYW